MTKQPARLSLNRETVRRLDSGELGQVAAGFDTAGTCPVSACICVTGIICREISVLICNIAISGGICV